MMSRCHLWDSSAGNCSTVSSKSSKFSTKCRSPLVEKPTSPDTISIIDAQSEKTSNVPVVEKPTSPDTISITDAQSEKISKVPRANSVVVTMGIVAAIIMLIGAYYASQHFYMKKAATGRPDMMGEGNPSVQKNRSNGAEAELRSFVDNYLFSSNHGNISQLLSLYSEQVDYFDKGLVNKNSIKEDKQYYYKRWPEVKNILKGGIIIENTSERDINLLKFVVDFQVHNSQRRERIIGEAQTILKVRINGNIRIIGENQTVLNREKQRY